MFIIDVNIYITVIIYVHLNTTVCLQSELDFRNGGKHFHTGWRIPLAHLTRPTSAVELERTNVHLPRIHHLSATHIFQMKHIIENLSEQQVHTCISTGQYLNSTVSNCGNTCENINGSTSGNYSRKYTVRMFWL